MAEPKAKATLSELDRSNLSNSASQRPTSSSSRYSDASKSENNKQKPQFIVKKVGTEELFKGTGKQNGLVGLSQINEENTADLDDLMPPRFVTNAKEGQKLPVNIFQTEMVSSEKYQEKLKGPSYKDGGIVKHSIVGSTDMFQRYERLQQKMAKENAGSPSKERIKSAKLQTNLSSQDGISISFSERPNTRGNYLGAGSRYSVLAEKKAAKNEVQLSKDEIIDQITKIKERQDISSRDQARATAKRPLSSKLYLTKEERNLNKFENTNNYWQRTVEDLSHKIGREEGSSLMVTSAKFREKRELIQMLDIIQTDEERFGSKLWYHTLRRTKGIANSKGASAALLPQTSSEIFQTTQLQKQITSLEFIRKPILVKTPAEANPPIERPASRLDGNYLETKMIARKHIIREIQPGEVEEMGDLAVKGKNKLKLEAEAILRQANKRESVHVPKRFFNKKEESGQEEVIAKGLAKREISRNGLNVFLN